MSLPLTNEYKFYELSGLAPGVFGECYLVITCVQTPHDFLGEFYLMTARPAERLDRDRYSYDQSMTPRELVNIDAAFVLEEQLNAARMKVIDRLEDRAKQENLPALEFSPFEFKERKASPFVGCWLHNRFHSSIVEIAKHTACEPLERYARAVARLAPIRPA